MARSARDNRVGPADTIRFWGQQQAQEAERKKAQPKQVDDDGQ